MHASGMVSHSFMSDGRRRDNLSGFNQKDKTEQGEQQEYPSGYFKQESCGRDGIHVGKRVFYLCSAQSDGPNDTHLCIPAQSTREKESVRK